MHRNHISGCDAVWKLYCTARIAGIKINHFDFSLLSDFMFIIKIKYRQTLKITCFKYLQQQISVKSEDPKNAEWSELLVNSALNSAVFC